MSCRWALAGMCIQVCGGFNSIHRELGLMKTAVLGRLTPLWSRVSQAGMNLVAGVAIPA